MRLYSLFYFVRNVYHLELLLYSLYLFSHRLGAWQPQVAGGALLEREALEPLRQCFHPHSSNLGPG